jgi:hypothetical protein
MSIKYMRPKYLMMDAAFVISSTHAMRRIIPFSDIMHGEMDV